MAKRAKGSGTLRKRSDGRWEGRIIIDKDENGKNIYKTVVSKKKYECEERLKALLDEKAEAEKQANETTENRYNNCKNPTVKEWIEIWINNYCKGYLKPTTVDGYEAIIKSYINPYIGNMNLKDLTTLTCQQYIMDIYENGRVNKERAKNNKKEIGLSSRTIKSVKIVLHAALQKAVDEEIIIKNPTNNLNLPKGRERGMRTLTKEESNRLLVEAHNSGCFEFYYLELTTGLRLGEITALEWDDFDPDKMSLRINKQAQRIDGVIRPETPKTKASIRTIALNKSCVDILNRLKSQQARGTKLMFPSPVTGTYRDQNGVLRQLKRMLKRAKLPDVRFHDLRHTCATIALEEGVDIKAVSNMLGHTDCGFTMNTYIHATEKLKQSAADKMQSAFEIGFSQAESNIIIENPDTKSGTISGP